MVGGKVRRFVWLRQFAVGRDPAGGSRLLERLEFLQALWDLMPESAGSYAKAVWSSFGPPVFAGEKDVHPPEGRDMRQKVC